MALFDNVGVDAIDAGGGIGGNVAVAVVLSGFVDLEIAEIGQVCWSESFGSLFLLFGQTHTHTCQRLVLVESLSGGLPTLSPWRWNMYTPRMVSSLD